LLCRRFKMPGCVEAPRLAAEATLSDYRTVTCRLRLALGASRRLPIACLYNANTAVYIARQRAAQAVVPPCESKARGNRVCSWEKLGRN